MQLERIESNIHNDTIAENILFMYIVVQNIQCGTGDRGFSMNLLLWGLTHLYMLSHV